MARHVWLCKLCVQGLCSFLRDSVNCVTLHTFRHIMWEVERLVVYESHCIEILMYYRLEAIIHIDIFWHWWSFYSTDGLQLFLRVETQMVAGRVFQHGEGQGHTRVTRICWVWDKRRGESASKVKSVGSYAISALDIREMLNLDVIMLSQISADLARALGQQMLNESSGDLGGSPKKLRKDVAVVHFHNDVKLVSTNTANM